MRASNKGRKPILNHKYTFQLPSTDGSFKNSDSFTGDSQESDNIEYICKDKINAITKRMNNQSLSYNSYFLSFIRRKRWSLSCLFFGKLICRPRHFFMPFFRPCKTSLKGLCFKQFLSEISITLTFSNPKIIAHAHR